MDISKIMGKKPEPIVEQPKVEDRSVEIVNKLDILEAIYGGDCIVHLLIKNGTVQVISSERIIPQAK